jgi:hypothetical protein
LKGGTWVDITATKGSIEVRIQTVSTLAAGTLTRAEAAAIARIQAAFPGGILFNIPKVRR